MRPADFRQREQARNPDHSCIVQAPAGSGKTELLTQRMLALLARAEQPEEVVAITFTRKAAAEMHHRLVGQLRLASQPGMPDDLEPYQQTSFALAREVLGNSEARGWNLLQHSARLRIRTIDSLCNDLSRQLPILSGLGGGQQIADDVEARYRQAAARTMAAVENARDPNQRDVVALLDRYDNQYDQLVELLTAMLGRRDQWLPHLLSHREGDGFDRSVLEETLCFLVEDQLQQAREQIPDLLWSELPGLLEFIAGQLGEDGSAQRALLQAFSGTGELQLPARASLLPYWKSLAGLLLTQDGKWRSRYTYKEGFPGANAAKTAADKDLFQAMKARMMSLVDSVRGDETLREQLATVALLPNPAYEDEAWESLESMMRLLLRAAQEWRILIAETGEADFSEISGRAIEALGAEGEPSPLALRLDYRIRHLLVDEFQDTSHSQIRLLERLTAGWTEGDGRTLFLVGDPMQSIYRFRKAEVSLFMQAFSGQLFRHIRLQPIRLTVNFRSTRPVVDWVNHVFPVVFPDHDDPVMGAVAYSASQTRPGVATDGCVLPHFSLGDDRQAEARAIVDLVAAAGVDDSIAVLVRSRAHAADLLALLDQRREADSRFRYQAVELNPLGETQHIRDLVSLTLALVQGADRLAWLALLRTPWIGLSLADLDTLFGADWNARIADALDPGSDISLAGVSDDGRQRLERVAPVLTSAVGRCGYLPMRDVVESAWLQLGGPACAGNESELEDARTYFDLLESLENEGLPVDRDTLSARLDKLYAEPDARASGRLQIMTIHKAKGLQFDIVILPGLDRNSGKPEHRMLHWFEIVAPGPGADRIAFSPMRNAEEKEQASAGDLIRFISRVESQREAFEAARLLYVAATRAKRQLHLFASIKPGARDEIRPRANTPAARLWPVLEQEQLPILESQLEGHALAQAGHEATASILQQYRRLPADWRLPDPPAAVAPVAWKDPEPQELIPFEWAQQDARLTGELVHRLLQEVTRHGVAAWKDGLSGAGHRDWCRERLLREGLDRARADSVAERALAALQRSLDSPRGSWILSSDEEAHSEFALTAVLDGVPRNLVLDRTFVENGERWIIDYKTSTHSGGGLAGFLDNEEERYRDQLRLYRDAVALTDTRPIRCALYFPLLDAFREVNWREPK